ncbi:MAG TPA: BlaI/MecI/CopY family transcriptional regulator [Candidatus Limiplasma sp.]|nr:BlaI/MecI/CopY family transcriptional regulator [Candidatus Limiplasma sp.]HRX09606.1 BlaI/MecI/CopY family transcriptional regulator [Candidatus Limiplasma sp.]
MPIQLTDAEWKIIELLWDKHPRSMPEITKALEPATGWTRHTIITLLKRMEVKGTVAVDESGSVKMYSPKITREQATTEQTRKFLSRVFSGKTSLLISNLVDSGEADVEDIQAILDIIKQNHKTTGK